MKKQLQKLVFIISVLAAFLNPILEEASFLKYVLLISAIFYLVIGWFLPLLREDGGMFENGIVGFVYATVFIAGYLSYAKMPLANYLTYFGILLALSLMLYALIKRSSVRKDLFVQAIILLLISPIPLWFLR